MVSSVPRDLSLSSKVGSNQRKQITSSILKKLTQITDALLIGDYHWKVSNGNQKGDIRVIIIEKLKS
jgi:hypothetical protein